MVSIVLKEILIKEYFGNTIQQYLIFVGLCIAGIILGKLAYYISKTIIKALTRKTKTELDDILVEVIEKPMILALLIIGFFAGYKQLNLSPSTEAVFLHIVFILTVIAIGWFILRLVDKIIEHYLMPIVAKSETDLDDHLVPLLRKLVKYIVIAIVILVILSNLGVNVTSAIAGLGIGGLAVALAAQESLKNILGGIAILGDKPFKLGEWIEVDKYQGTVVEIGLRSTRLKTATGEYVTVPNGLIASTSVSDYTRYTTRKINFNLGLVYETAPEKIEKAKEIILKLLQSNEKIIKDTILVNFTQYGAYSLDINVNFEVSTNNGAEMLKIKDYVNMGIKKEFTKSKIELAYSTQRTGTRK